MTSYHSTLVFAYHERHRNTLEQLAQVMESIGYQITHIVGEDRQDQLPLADQLGAAKNQTIVLFISEHFLKSAVCMRKNKDLLQLIRENEQLHTVILDGESIDSVSGEKVFTPTEFEKMGDVMVYMNFWQSQYLELRRILRETPPQEQEALNAQIKIVRDISAEVAEFLRQLRTLDIYAFNDLKSNEYGKFFALLGAQDLRLNIHHSDESSSSSAPELTEEPELPENIDLREIPGMELLAEVPEKEEYTWKESAHVFETLEDEQAEPEQIAKPMRKALEALAAAEFENQEDVAEEDLSEDNKLPDSESEKAHAVFNDEHEVEEEDEEDDVADVADEYEELSSVSEHIKQLLAQSHRLIDAGDADGALQLIYRTVLESPGNPTLRYYYAQFLLQLAEDNEAARHELQAAVTLDRNHLPSLFLLAELDEFQGLTEQARLLYEQVLGLDSNYPGVHFRLGNLLARNYPNDAESAARHFKKAIKQNKKHAEAHYQYAQLMSDPLNSPDLAEKHFIKTLKYKPEHPFAHFDLAMLYLKKMDPENALSAYKKAIECNPYLETPANDALFASTHTSPTSPDIMWVPNIDSEINYGVPESSFENSTQVSSNFTTDKTGLVFISGATSGIGMASAREFARQGYHLILCGRRLERLEALKTELEDRYHVRVRILQFDVRDQTSVQSAIHQLDDDWKQIDILVNNAGLAQGLAPIHEGDIQDWDTMIDTNVKGLLYLTRAITPHMVARKSGHVVNVASTAGKEVYPMGNVYCATKFAVDALTKAMRLDLVQHGIRVSQVSPAHVEETEFALVRFHGDAERADIYQDFQPLKASDVADAIYYICSRPAHVNIQDIVLMGTQQASSTVINRSGREK
jgi:NADP-dependent 3-hydroxy acid dehydrogenase YdfG/Tfp pilus assembly protein PilF